jgi:hypothetical protein
MESTPLPIFEGQDPNLPFPGNKILDVKFDEPIPPNGLAGCPSGIK